MKMPKPNRDTILVVATVISLVLTAGILYFTYTQGHEAGREHPECLQKGAILYQNQLVAQCQQTQQKTLTLNCGETPPPEQPTE